MKTKYEAPELNVLKLCVEDVIATSSTVSGLKTEQEWTGSTTGSTGSGQTWGDLFG